MAWKVRVGSTVTVRLAGGLALNDSELAGQLLLALAVVIQTLTGGSPGHRPAPALAPAPALGTDGDACQHGQRGGRGCA